MTTGTAGLELRRVTKEFGGGYFNKNITVAVDDISLSISPTSPVSLLSQERAGAARQP